MNFAFQRILKKIANLISMLQDVPKATRGQHHFSMVSKSWTNALVGFLKEILNATLIKGNSDLNYD